LLESALFGARFIRHFGVVNRNELAHLRELVLGLLQSGPYLDNRHQPAVLSAQLRELTRVAETAWVGERPLDFLGAGEGGR
jgi:hypothetical protein